MEFTSRVQIHLPHGSSIPPSAVLEWGQRSEMGYWGVEWGVKWGQRCHVRPHSNSTKNNQTWN